MNTANIIDIILLAVIVIAIPAYVKKRAEVIAERGLERYKNELTRASNQELEKLKGEIARNNKWEEIRMARLREEQGVVFKELYSKLARLFDTGRELLRVDADWLILKRSKGDTFIEALEAFDASYETQKIWLNNPLCEQIDSFRAEIERAFAPHIHSLLDGYVGDVDATSHQTMLILESGIARTKVEIEARFRELMHV